MEDELEADSQERPGSQSFADYGEGGELNVSSDEFDGEDEDGLPQE